MWVSPFRDLRINGCLLYTSDAADEARSVDLGGRRIIKKKFFKEEDGILDTDRSRGLGDVYKRQVMDWRVNRAGELTLFVHFTSIQL